MDPNDIQDWAGRAAGADMPSGKGDESPEADEVDEETHDDVGDLRGMADSLKDTAEKLEGILKRAEDNSVDAAELKELPDTIAESVDKLKKLAEDIEDKLAEDAAAEEEEDADGDDGDEAPAGADDGGLA